MKNVIRVMLAGIFLACAIGSIVRGSIVTNKMRDDTIAKREQEQRVFDADPLHAPIPEYLPLPTLYDGPWLLLEVVFLGAMVITAKIGAKEK